MNTFKIKKGINEDWRIVTNTILGMVFESLLFNKGKEF